MVVKADKTETTRVVVVMPNDVLARLEALTELRFAGNRSRAVVALVDVGLAVYAAPKNEARIITGTADALSGVGANVGKA